MRSAGIILAAGSGLRDGRPKHLVPLCGRPMLEWSLEAFLAVPDLAELALVLCPEAVRELGGRLASERVRVVEGGATRLDSVRLGVKALSGDADVIAVHDASRPLVTPELAAAVLEEAYESGAAVAASPVRDTLKKVASKELWVAATPVRTSYWLAQTPRCYRAEILAEALAAFPEARKAPDESQLVERAGHPVRLVPSSAVNMEVSTPEDAAIAEAFLKRRQKRA